MSSMRLIAVAVVPMLLGMGGCNATPNLDSKFGYAVNAAKAQQTLNPDAALKADPVAGIDAPDSRQQQDDKIQKSNFFDIAFHAQLSSRSSNRSSANASEAPRYPTTYPRAFPT